LYGGKGEKKSSDRWCKEEGKKKVGRLRTKRENLVERGEAPRLEEIREKGEGWVLDGKKTYGSMLGVRQGKQRGENNTPHLYSEEGGGGNHSSQRRGITVLNPNEWRVSFNSKERKGVYLPRLN